MVNNRVSRTSFTIIRSPLTINLFEEVKVMVYQWKQLNCLAGVGNSALVQSQEPRRSVG